MTTDSNPQVSGEAEKPELPTPVFSEPPASSPSEGADDALVSKLAERLAPTIEQIIERKVQSTKDKRLSKVDKIERALGGNLDLLADLEQQGVPIPAELKTEYRLRDMEARLNQPQPAPTRDAGTSQAGSDVAAAALAEVTKHGLSGNDPAFIDLLRGQYRNRDAFDAAVKGYILDKVTKPQPPASPAGVVQGAAVGSPEPSPDQKVADYKREMRAARGKPTELRAIKDKYLKMGVDVYAVDFSS